MYKGDNFCDFLFAALNNNPLLKNKVYSERKEFAPKGIKFLPFWVDSFSEGKQKPFDRVASLENVPILLKSVDNVDFESHSETDIICRKLQLSIIITYNSIICQRPVKHLLLRIAVHTIAIAHWGLSSLSLILRMRNQTDSMLSRTAWSEEQNTILCTFHPGGKNSVSRMLMKLPNYD